MLCRARYRERTECEKLGHLVKRGFAQVPEILGCLEYTHFAIRGECSRCGEFISVGEMLPVDVAVQLGCRVEATW